MCVLQIDIRRADNHNCDEQAVRMTRAVSILADSCFYGKDEFDMIFKDSSLQRHTKSVFLIPGRKDWIVLAFESSSEF